MTAAEREYLTAASLVKELCAEASRQGCAEPFEMQAAAIGLAREVIRLRAVADRSAA